VVENIKIYPIRYLKALFTSAVIHYSAVHSHNMAVATLLENFVFIKLF